MTTPAQPAASSASAAAVGTIPFRPAEDAGLPAGIPGASWFILVLVLLAGAALMLKRRLRPWQAEPGLLNVKERRALTTSTQLVVLHYAGRRLLLSVGPTGTQVLRDDADGEPTT